MKVKIEVDDSRSEDEVMVHTKDKQYQVKCKLYELEEMLSEKFMRVAKAVIVNVDQIYAVTKNLTASSGLQFYETSKKSYVSRGYYRKLKTRLSERRRKLK
ncbi:MAG: LytTR family DNA-binding domain-containing protein [Anaerorhabdus sp.]